jgi:hypothetical protein
VAGRFCCQKRSDQRKGREILAEQFVDIIKVLACPCGAEQVLECDLMPSLVSSRVGRSWTSKQQRMKVAWKRKV